MYTFQGRLTENYKEHIYTYNSENLLIQANTPRAVVSYLYDHKKRLMAITTKEFIYFDFYGFFVNPMNMSYKNKKEFVADKDFRLYLVIHYSIS